MRRRFNITGLCSPERHYMVRLDDRLKKIKEDYIDYDRYFLRLLNVVAFPYWRPLLMTK